MAIWAEIKKAINSDFSKPLNVLINDLQLVCNNIDKHTELNRYNISNELLKDVENCYTSTISATNTASSSYSFITAAKIMEYIPDADGYLKFVINATFTQASGKSYDRMMVRLCSGINQGLTDLYKDGGNLAGIEMVEVGTILTQNYDTNNHYNVLGCDINLTAQFGKSSVTKDVELLVPVKRNQPVTLILSVLSYGSSGLTVSGKINSVKIYGTKQALD